MSGREDWDAWRSEWGAVTAEQDAGPAALRARLERERRRVRSTAAAEAALVVAAVVGILGTLLHTADRRDVVRVTLVLILIAGASLVEVWRRRHAAASPTQPTESYVHETRQLCLRQRRAVRFLWVLLAITAAFVVPWWIEGFIVHRGDVGSALALFALWLPAVILAGVLAWTLRANRRIADELRRLDRWREEEGPERGV